MYKALIIDDEKPVRIVITALGKWSTYGIDAPALAFNGKEGLSVMREYHPNIVFVDMEMPIMNGIEFLKQASKEFEDVKYIVISGYDDFQYAQSAIKSGAIDYILKPIVEEELNRAIQKAVTLLNYERNIMTIKSIDVEEATASQVVELIKDQIDSYYTRDIKLTDFSNKYFFTKSYLSKLFKKTYGYGAYEYVLHLRMERAKELLTNSDLPIKDISERLGYSNNNYFSKAFKNNFGVSPTDFKDGLPHKN
jgi:YesN/AraC family two-component response regulator